LLWLEFCILWLRRLQWPFLLLVL